MLIFTALLVVTCLTTQVTAQGATSPVSCESEADIYIVITGSDTMVLLPELMQGARSGLAGWFARTGHGPQISVCTYGTRAVEQIKPGDLVIATAINMVHGISRLDQGIECARQSSQKNRRSGVPQYMVLIVAEDPLGYGAADFTDDARHQIMLARLEGFVRVTLTTVSDNVYPDLIEDFADEGYSMHIESDFIGFSRRANPPAGSELDMSLWRQYCPATACPRNVLIAVDTSSSVSRRRFADLQSGLQLMMGNLNIAPAADNVAICYFGSSVATIVPLVPFHDRAAINSAIGASFPLRGTTRVSSGLSCLETERTKSKRSNAQTTYILVVDGNPSDPPNDASELSATRSLIDQFKTHGSTISVSAIGPAFTDMGEIIRWTTRSARGQRFHHLPTFEAFRQQFETPFAFDLPCQDVSCTSNADIYIVITGSDTMVNLPQLMQGARSGLSGWFARTGDGPQISVCAYGTHAVEQIVLGDRLDASAITMVSGISRLDLGIECARLSSHKNRRQGVPQYMVLIVAEDPLGYGAADFTDDARHQIMLARLEGFVRVTLTTVSDNIYPGGIRDFADQGYSVHMESDFTEFARRANPLPEHALDMPLWRQYCPATATHVQTRITPAAVSCNSNADIYIVITGSSNMVLLPELMQGARSGLSGWFARTGDGPQISVCTYGAQAVEQIKSGDLLNANAIHMVSGVSRLDLGIECARLSSQNNRRQGVPQYMVLIVAEDPIGYGADDFTDQARQQLLLARLEGFARVTLTTVSDNVYPELIRDFADQLYSMHIESDFTEFARRANPLPGHTLDMPLWRQYCPGK